MTVPRSTLVVVGACFALVVPLQGVGPLAAQEPASDASVSDTVRPRIGLALSGGSARGFAHVGVIEVLEQAGVPVDLIAGTSMGGVIGGLYASGLTTEDLRKVASEVDWDRIFSDAPERRNLPIERKPEQGRTVVGLPIIDGRPRIPSGIIQGQRITQLLTGLTWHVHSVSDFRDLPIPFVAVATDVETGEAVVLRDGFLPEAIRASLAIPSVFAPVEIDGRYLIDGGMARNLPAPDAADLGADFIICSDVTEPLATADSLLTLVDILTQSMAYRMVERRDEDARRCDVVIRPDIKGIESGDFKRSEEIIARGTEAATAALDSLHILGLTGLTEESAAHDAPPLIGPFVVTDVRVSGLERTHESRVLHNLGIHAFDTVDVRDVNRAVNRVYDTGMFQRVSYRLDLPPGREADAGERVLDVHVQDEGRSWVGVGYRYEGRYKASILGTAAVRNLLVRGSTLLADLRLGEQTRLSAEFQERLGWGLAPLFGLRADYRGSPFDLFEAGERVAEPRVRVLDVEASVGAGIGYSTSMGVVGKFEAVDADDAPLAPDWNGGEQSFVTLSGVVRFDSRDRLTFTRSGVVAVGRTEWGEGAEGGRGTFSQHMLDVRAVVPLARSLSLQARGSVGTSGGDALPSHYQFFVGGVNDFHLYPDRHLSFAGLRVQEARGRHLQLLDLGLQWEVARNVFTLFRWNAAALPDEWHFDTSDFFTGFGVGGGVLTRGGSARLLVTGGNTADAVRVELDVGFQF